MGGVGGILGDCIEILFIGSVYCKKDKEEGKHPLLNLKNKNKNNNP